MSNSKQNINDIIFSVIHYYDTTSKKLNVENDKLLKLFNIQLPCNIDDILKILNAKKENKTNILNYLGLNSANNHEIYFGYYPSNNTDVIDIVIKIYSDSVYFFNNKNMSGGSNTGCIAILKNTRLIKYLQWANNSCFMDSVFLNFFCFNTQLSKYFLLKLQNLEEQNDFKKMMTNFLTNTTVFVLRPSIDNIIKKSDTILAFIQQHISDAVYTVDTLKGTFNGHNCSTDTIAILLLHACTNNNPIAAITESNKIIYTHYKYNTKKQIEKQDLNFNYSDDNSAILITAYQNMTITDIKKELVLDDPIIKNKKIKYFFGSAILASEYHYISMFNIICDNTTKYYYVDKNYNTDTITDVNPRGFKCTILIYYKYNLKITDLISDYNQYFTKPEPKLKLYTKLDNKKIIFI